VVVEPRRDWQQYALHQSFGSPASIGSNRKRGELFDRYRGPADNVSSVIVLGTGGLAYMAEGDFAFKDLGVTGFITNLGRV
jgi:hypothetical protein